MSEWMAPDLATGAMALTLALLYAAWHEAQKQNRRDARLLATAAAVGLAGSAAWWWA